MKNKIIIILTKNIAIILGIFLFANYNIINASSIFTLFKQKVSEWNTQKDIIRDYIFHAIILIIIVSIIIKTIYEIIELKKNSTKQ